MPDRRDHRALWIINVTMTVAMVVLVVALGFSLARPDPFDPFDYFPHPRDVERITGAAVTVPTVDGYTGPAVRLGDTVPTTGTVCNIEPRSVESIGVIEWERVDIRGQRVRVRDNIPGTIASGCTDLRFENPIPAEVANSVRSSGEAQRWRIVGSATPTRPGGVTSTWEIEPFWILP